MQDNEPQIAGHWTNPVRGNPDTFTVAAPLSWFGRTSTFLALSTRLPRFIAF